MAKKTPPQADVSLETVADLRVALRRFEAATERLAAANQLTARQYDLLALLHAPSRSGSLASAIADQLSISRNAMTELVSRAAAAGLVDRGDDAADARRKPLKPTAEGTRRFTAAVKALTPERDHLLELLRNAAQATEQLTAGTPEVSEP